MIQKIANNVYWVGIVDWGLRRFHGHELSTPRGTTYNAYLIKDKKTVLVDTVLEPFGGQLLDNIREIVDPATIDYVVANHAEPDHSGSLPLIMQHAPKAKLVVSKSGAESFEGHYHRGWKVKAVGTGDSIDIGANKLVFVEAPMLHWPDSMFTYLTGENVLMPNDAFGQHYATAFRFNDQVDEKTLADEALKYYANILTPYSSQVGKKIDEVLALNLPVDIIAPSHGVIWRDNPLQIVETYHEWAKQIPEPCAAILYDTMWNATGRMAEAIGHGLADEGVDYRLIHTAVTDRNDALVDVFRSRMIVVGSPTLNYGLLPTIAPLLEDLRGLKFKNKLGAAFGSYGWSGESVKVIEERFAASGIPIVREGIRCKWQPSSEDLDACRSFGRELGVKTKQPI
jgi:flavorubredoxin